MRKYTEKMLKCALNNEGEIKDGICRSFGNHIVETEYGYMYMYYHNSPIIIIDTEVKTVTINNFGYNTTSTTQAINSHLEGIKEYFYFDDEYAFIDKTEGKKFAKIVKNLFNIDSMDNKEFNQLLEFMCDCIQ